MLEKQLVPMVLSALLLASPLALAEEAHHPEQAGAETKSATTLDAPAAKESGDAAADSESATTPAPGMPPPGMAGQGGGMMMPGMMHKRMMAGMQGMQGMGGMMGRGPMMGCMHGMGGNMMKKGMMGGPGMMQMHQQVVTRLDLIDARLAKIEALFGRLMQR